MNLIKEQTIDKIEVLGNGIIQVREVTRIMEDGKELSSSYRRWTLSPGQDISNEESRVQTICNAMWTEEVIAAYQAQRQS